MVAKFSFSNLVKFIRENSFDRGDGFSFLAAVVVRKVAN